MFYRLRLQCSSLSAVQSVKSISSLCGGPLIYIMCRPSFVAHRTDLTSGLLTANFQSHLEYKIPLSPELLNSMDIEAWVGNFSSSIFQAL